MLSHTTANGTRKSPRSERRGATQALANRHVIDKIINRLAEAEQPLPRSLHFYRQILTAQNKTKPPDLSRTLTRLREKATQRLSQGKPILTFQNLAADWADIQSLFREVTTLASDYLSPMPEETEELGETSADLALLTKAARTWFAIGTVSRKSMTKNKDMKPLTFSVLQASLRPLLTVYANELLPLVKQELWYRPYCPVCGGSPDFAFLDKERGARWLLCSRCDAQWLFYRLVCPYCGNQDQKTLAYFADDKSLYRLYVCEKCRGYVKAIDLRQTEAEILLPLERILTLDMDRQAHELKYEAAEYPWAR